MASAKSSAKWIADKAGGGIVSAATLGIVYWLLSFAGALMIPAICGAFIAAIFVWLAMACYVEQKRIREELSRLKISPGPAGAARNVAIGIFRSIDVFYEGGGSLNPLFARVFFVVRVSFKLDGLVKFSPREMRITTPEGNEISKIIAEKPSDPTCSMVVQYRGSCTHGSIPWIESYTRDEVPANDATDGTRFVYRTANLEVRLLEGEGSRLHEDSGVKLAFELDGRDAQPFTIHLGPENPFKFPAAITVRL